MISVNEALPEHNQKVLIDVGDFVNPAIYDADRGIFKRYPNYAEGDRCVSYFYSGVLFWEPFPEPRKQGGFVSEPEIPIPTPDMSVPLSKETLALLFPGKHGEAYRA